MKSFDTSILITASVDKIWQVLIDVAHWPDWNTTVDKVEGAIGLGKSVTLYAKANPGQAFPLKITEFDPPKRMVWAGGMPLGLFKGQRTYTLTQQGNAVEFMMQETFSGLMAPLITQSIPDLQPTFDEFATCLKRKAESDNSP